MDTDQAGRANEVKPVVVMLGKKSKKAIRGLKQGRGRAMDEVMDVVEQVRAGLGAQAEGKMLVPVVVVYRRKARRRGWF